jgi:hypothetical protein
VQTGTEEKRTLLISVIRRKNPLRDLHRVVEHPVGSARGYLSEGYPGGHLTFSVCRRRKKDIIP